MEYFKVIVPGKEDEEIDVLINGEKNGRTGEIQVLESSSILVVSVDRPGAEERTVEVRDTTAAYPMIIELRA